MPSLESVADCGRLGDRKAFADNLFVDLVLALQIHGIQE